MKKIACIISNSPYGYHDICYAIEMIMAFAIFDIEPHVFFIDDGVFNLLKEQNTEKEKGQKNIGKMIQSFDLLEINKIYVCRQSLQIRGVSESDCIGLPVIFDQEQFSQHISSFSSVLTF